MLSDAYSSNYDQRRFETDKEYVIVETFRYAKTMSNWWRFVGQFRFGS